MYQLLYQIDSLFFGLSSPVQARGRLCVLPFGDGPFATVSRATLGGGIQHIKRPLCLRHSGFFILEHLSQHVVWPFQNKEGQCCRIDLFTVVGYTGFEPVTSCLSSKNFVSFPFISFHLHIPTNIGNL